jgi:hypothetical protein
MDRLLQEPEPFMERKTHVFGHIRLYAPVSDPQDWDKQPWVLRTDKGGKDGRAIVAHLRAESVMEAWKRPSFITSSMRYEDGSLELSDDL